MPIYEYQCLECNTIFEKRQGFFDESKAECPECHYSETRRLIAAPAIVFKGSGFYVTDNRNNGKANSNGKGNSNKNPEKSTDSSEKSTDTHEKSADSRDKSTDSHEKSTDTHEKSADSRDKSTDSREKSTSKTTEPKTEKVSSYNE